MSGPTVLTESPTVEVTAVRSPRSGIWSLIVARCPYCGRRHSHGGGSGEAPYYGGRLSHCWDVPCGEYDLVPAPEDTLTEAGR